MDNVSLAIRDTFTMIVTAVGTDSVALPDWSYFCRLVEDLSLTRSWTIRARAWWHGVGRIDDAYVRSIVVAIDAALEAAEIWVGHGNDPADQMRERIGALLETAVVGFAATSISAP